MRSHEFQQLMIFLYLYYRYQFIHEFVARLSMFLKDKVEVSNKDGSITQETHVISARVRVV